MRGDCLLALKMAEQAESVAKQAVEAPVVASEDAVDALLAAADAMEELEIPSSDSEPEDVMDMIAETFMTMKTDCEDCGVSLEGPY